MFPFFETKHLGFAAYFFACIHETTVSHVLKSTVECRTLHTFSCDTFSSWQITFWILNSELTVHEMFRQGDVCDRSLVELTGPSICHRVTCGQFMQTRVSQATQSCPMGIPWDVEKRCWRWEVWSHRVWKPLLVFLCLPPHIPCHPNRVSSAGHAERRWHPRKFSGAHRTSKTVYGLMF